MPTSDTARILSTAIACWATGLLAVWASAGPDHVATLFPPAGIGLALTLVFGRRMLIGVFLGSAAMVLTLLEPTAEFGRTGWLLAGSLGLARVAQVAVGTALLRRLLPDDAPPPSETRAIVLLLSFAAPLSSAVSAAGGIFTLASVGLLPAGHALETGLRWWVADTLGAAVFVPATLALVARPRFEWRPLVLSVSVPLLLVGTVLAAALARQETEQRQADQAAFARKAGDAARALSDRIDDVLLTLEAAHSFATSSEAIERGEFRHYMAPFLERTPIIQAIGLSTYVRAGERDAFERRMRESRFPDFRISERGPDNALRPASRNPDHMVITLIEPLQPNRRALGLDSLSVPQAAKAIRRAIRSGTQTASAGFELTQASELGVVIYQGVEASASDGDDTQAQEAARAAGVVFVTVRLDSLARQSFEPFAHDLGYCLYDLTGPERATLAGDPDCDHAATPSGPDWRRELAVAGRTWEVEFRPRPIPVPAMQTGARAMSGFAAVFGTLTLASFLMSIGGRAGQVARLVDQRTRKLAEEIVERRRITGALARSEQRLRTLFGSTPVGIVEMTPDNRIQQANPCFCELVRLREATLIGRRLLELTDVYDREDETRAWEALISRSIGTSHRHLRLLRGDGTSIKVDAVTTSILDAHGQPVRIVSVIQDLTDADKRRAAETAREKAEAASRAKSEFVARMSHELRTPLNALLGFAQLLTSRPDEPLTPSQAEAVRVIEQSGWHLLDMINDLLELSRIESGHVRVDIRPVDVEAIIAECVHLVETLRAKAGVTIITDIAASARDVEADPTRLRQVLLNLLSNAIKYNRAGGFVRIEVSRSPGSDRIAIRVRDTGAGMTPEQLGHLFEPFNRLGRDDTVPGTGIGLTIALNLVNLMRGELGVESRPGEGSCFSVTLPAAATTGPRRPASLPAPIR